MTTYQSVEALARQHGYKSYNDYLFRSPHWKGLRKAMNLPNNPCCVCFGASSVPHHIRYRNLIDVTTNDLIAMCMKCHDDFHLACRIMSRNYIGMETLSIRELVRVFRSTDFYRKREEKLSRRKVGKKPKPSKKQDNPDRIFKKCLNRCRSEKYSVSSLETLVAEAQKIIKSKLENLKRISETFSTPPRPGGVNSLATQGSGFDSRSVH